MAFVLPDPATEFGAKVARRLAGDRIAWFTLVDKSGTPQPAPVWFLWDDSLGAALVYNQPSAKRTTRYLENPRSSLHLNDTDGADFVVFTGITTAAPDAPPAHENPAYVEKYAGGITGMFGTPEKFGAQYSVPLLFVPSKVRGF